MIWTMLMAASAAIGPVPAFFFGDIDPAPVRSDQVEAWRSGGWRWCNREGDREPAAECMAQQDAAVLTIVVSRIKVAPPVPDADFVASQLKYCDELYADHGSGDLRILSMCLAGTADSVQLERAKAR